jgi:beta-lactamase class A
VVDAKVLNTGFDEVALRAKPGVLGVGVMNLENESTYSLNGDRPFPMQSVFKAPLGAAVLAQVDLGKVSLDEIITIEDKDLSPPYSPVADAYPARKTYTVRELLVAAVGGSDNTAADVLMKRIGGPGSVTAWLQFNKIVALRVDRYERQLQPELAGMPSFRPAWKGEQAYSAALHAVPLLERRTATLKYLADREDTSTPRAALDFLHLLATGALLSKDSTRLLLQIMTDSPTGAGRIKAALPAGARWAHKTGSARTDLGLTPATNDIGILTMPDGRRYAVAVFLEASPLDEEGRDALIAQAGRAVIRGLE